MWLRINKVQKFSNFNKVKTEESKELILHISIKFRLIFVNGWYNLRIYRFRHRFLMKFNLSSD